MPDQHNRALSANRYNLTFNMLSLSSDTFKDETQFAVFKDPGRTAQLILSVSIIKFIGK
jgi:hypothetical protein